MNSLLAVQWTGLSCYVHGKSTDKICHLLKIFAKNYMRSLWPKNWRTKISSSSNLQFPIATLTFLSFQLLVSTYLFWILTTFNAMWMPVLTLLTISDYQLSFSLPGCNVSHQVCASFKFFFIWSIRWINWNQKLKLNTKFFC